MISPMKPRLASSAQVYPTMTPSTTFGQLLASLGIFLIISWFPNKNSTNKQLLMIGDGKEVERLQSCLTQLISKSPTPSQNGLRTSEMAKAKV